MTDKKVPTKIAHKTSAWIKFLYAGVKDDTFSKNIRRIFVINLFSTIGIIFMLPLGVRSLLVGDTFIGCLLLFISLLYTVNHIYLRYTYNHTVSGSFVIYPLYGLMLYLVYTGGVDHTGHVWIFCVPAVSLFLHGMKQGLIELSCFTIVLIIVMFFIDGHFSADIESKYDSLRPRVLYSFLVVVFLSGIYEYSMSRSNDELEAASEKLELAASTDSLTGLLNRRGMFQKLDSNDSEYFHLLLADVDFFKRINDKYGHDVGDYTLNQLAKIIQSTVPESELAARWGGEEFLIALPSGKYRGMKKQDAYDLAELIRQRVEAFEFEHLGLQFSVSLSFGVATMDSKTNLRETISLADNYLYMAKNEGRNRVYQG